MSNAAIWPASITTTQNSVQPMVAQGPQMRADAAGLRSRRIPDLLPDKKRARHRQVERLRVLGNSLADLRGPLETSGELDVDVSSSNPELLTLSFSG